MRAAVVTILACVFFVPNRRGAQTPLPPAKVPAVERLWTVWLVADGTEADQREQERLAALCPDAAPDAASSAALVACRRRNLNPAPRRIASLYAAPDSSSPVVAHINQLRFIGSAGEFLSRWTVEPASPPRRTGLVWPESDAVSDYGLVIDGVQRRGDWVRLLSSIPIDGWWSIAPTRDGLPPRPIAAVNTLSGQIFEFVGALSATGADGKRRAVAAGSYLIQRIAGGVVYFRQEVSTDFDCGQDVEPPKQMPPTLHVPASELFDSSGTPRFGLKYTKGC